MSTISDKDKKDWENFINSKNKLEDKDKNLNNTSTVKPLTTIDLHGYTLEQANQKVSELIKISFEKGFRNLNIITGKGNRSKNKNDPYQSKDLSILKYSVPNFIINNPELMSKILYIDKDSVNDPTYGSFDILLKKK